MMTKIYRMTTPAYNELIAYALDANEHSVLKARPNFQVANWATWKPLQVVQLMTR